MSDTNTPQLAELLGLLRRARDPWARLRLVAQGATALARLTPAQRADLLRTLGLDGAEELAELAAGGDPKVEKTLEGVLRTLESDPRRVEAIARDIADPRKRRSTLAGLAAHVLEAVTAPGQAAEAVPPPPPPAPVPAPSRAASPGPKGGRRPAGTPAGSEGSSAGRGAPAAARPAPSASSASSAAAAAVAALEGAPPKPAPAPADSSVSGVPGAGQRGPTATPPPWTATPSRGTGTAKAPPAAPPHSPRPAHSSAPAHPRAPARSAGAAQADGAKPKAPVEPPQTQAIPSLETVPFAAAHGARPLERLRTLRRRLAAPGELSAEALAGLLDEAPASDWARRRALSAAFAAGLPGRVEEALSLLDRLASPAARRWALGDLAASRAWSDAEWERLLAAADTPLARRRLAAIRSRSAPGLAARTPGA